MPENTADMRRSLDYRIDFALDDWEPISHFQKVLIDLMQNWSDNAHLSAV